MHGPDALGRPRPAARGVVRSNYLTTEPIFVDASPSVESVGRTAQPWTLAIGLFVAALALVVVTLVGREGEGNWVSGPPTIAVPGADFEVTRGTGRRLATATMLEGLDASGTGVLSARVGPVEAERYPRVDAVVRALGPARPTIALLWRTREHPSRLFSKQLQWVDDRTAPVAVSANDGWSGTITGLAVAVRGRAPEPLALESVTLPGLSASTALREVAGQWTRHFPFRAHTNHFPFDEERSYSLSLLAAIAIAQALAALGYLYYARRRSIARDARVFWGIFLAGWLLLDLRWQVNLLRQHVESAGSFAGKSTDEKHLSGPDRELFALLQQVSAALPAPPARVTVLSSNSSLRFRSAFFLYPHSVNGVFAPEPKPENLRAGDYVLLFLYEKARYDRDARSLTWSDGQRRAVDEVLHPNPDFVLLRLR